MSDNAVAGTMLRRNLLFTICVDSHWLERIMARREWKMVANDLGFYLKEHP